MDGSNTESKEKASPIASVEGSKEELTEEPTKESETKESEEPTVTEEAAVADVVREGSKESSKKSEKSDSWLSLSLSRNRNGIIIISLSNIENIIVIVNNC